jgi:hypothetical protein
MSSTLTVYWRYASHSREYSAQVDADEAQTMAQGLASRTEISSVRVSVGTGRRELTGAQEYVLVR